MDEGYTINAVLSYQNNPTSGLSATLDSGALYECFLYCQPTNYLTQIFGHSPTTYRALALVFGVLSLFTIYLATRKAFSTATAIIVTLLINFSYLHIAWSTQARWYTMALTFTWTTIWCYLSFIETSRTKRQKSIFLTGLVASSIIAVLSHKLLIILPVLLLLHYLYTHHHKLLEKKMLLFSWLLLLVCTILSAYLTITHTGLITNLTFHYNLPYYLSFIWSHYWLLVPLAIFSLTQTVSSKHRWFFAWIFIGYLIPLSFLTDIVQYRYLFVVTPILFILATLGLLDLYQLRTEKVPHTKTLPLIIGASFLIIFFISPIGSALPHDRYWLEDNPLQRLISTPSRVYTPQPDWNAAYKYISDNRKDTDIVISSHPQFTKIFLNTPGYWIAFDYLGFQNKEQFKTADGTEFYVGAKTIEDLTSLQSITSNQHGFIVFDYMAQDGRISSTILDYINNHFSLAYHQKDTEYSEIWIYQF